MTGVIVLGGCICSPSCWTAGNRSQLPVVKLSVHECWNEKECLLCFKIRPRWDFVWVSAVVRDVSDNAEKVTVNYGYYTNLRFTLTLIKMFVSEYRYKFH